MSNSFVNYKKWHRFSPSRCLDNSIAIVKLHDEEEAKRLGLTSDDDDEGFEEGEGEDGEDVHIVYFQHRFDDLQNKAM